MPQDPFLLDQVQIEPGASGTRLIKRNAANGGLNMRDSVVTGGLDLVQLAGLRNVGGVLVVGRSGAGAQYATIQAALDVIPSSSSTTAPWLVLVGPGTYAETINVIRDGVVIHGLGGVTITSAFESDPDGAGAYHTVTVQSASGTSPRMVELRNLKITNAHANYACVRVVGALASTVGQVGVRLRDCDLTGTGKTIWATSANHVEIRGGSWHTSGTACLALVTDCASLDLIGVKGVCAVQCDYSSVSVTLPVASGSAYRIIDCPGVGAGTILSPAVSSTLAGAGSLVISGCQGMGTVTLAGNRSLTVVASAIGNLVLGGTTAATLVGSSRGTATGGTATLAEPTQRGSVVVAAATANVTFAVPHPDASYVLALEVAGATTNYGPWVTNKAATGFTVNFSGAEALTVLWSAIRAAGSAAN